jgi:hypothetical protein
MSSVRHQCEKQLTRQKQLPMPKSHHLEGLILKVSENRVAVLVPVLPGHSTSHLSRTRLELRVWTASETSLEMDKSCNSKCWWLPIIRPVLTLILHERVPCNLILKGVPVGDVT